MSEQYVEEAREHEAFPPQANTETSPLLGGSNVVKGEMLGPIRIILIISNIT
jgi:hypothetical protein